MKDYAQDVLAWKEKALKEIEENKNKYSFNYRGKTYNSLKELAIDFNIRLEYVENLFKDYEKDNTIDINKSLGIFIRNNTKGAYSYSVRYGNIIYPTKHVMAKELDVSYPLLSNCFTTGDFSPLEKTLSNYFEYKGETYKFLTEIAEDYDIDYAHLSHFYKKYNSIDKAVDILLHRKEQDIPFVYNNVKYQGIKDALSQLNLKKKDFYKELDSGKSVEEVLNKLNPTFKDKEKFIAQGKEYKFLADIAKEYGELYNFNYSTFLSLYKKTKSIDNTLEILAHRYMQDGPCVYNEVEYKNIQDVIKRLKLSKRKFYSVLDTGKSIRETLDILLK